MSDRPPAPNTDAPDPAGLLASLAFWVSLFGAAGLFAAATLSGQFLEAERHEAELLVGTQRVEALAMEIRRLELELRALESDPDYVAAVARRTLSRTGVDIANAVPMMNHPATKAAELTESDPWGVRICMHRIAGDSLLRSRLLMGAAALVLFGFTFLHARERRATI